MITLVDVPEHTFYVVPWSPSETRWADAKILNGGSSLAEVLPDDPEYCLVFVAKSRNRIQMHAYRDRFGNTYIKRYVEHSGKHVDARIPLHSVMGEQLCIISRLSWVTETRVSALDSTTSYNTHGKGVYTAPGPRILHQTAGLLLPRLSCVLTLHSKRTRGGGYTVIEKIVKPEGWYLGIITMTSSMTLSICL